MRLFLHSFLILALVTAWISPACSFLSSGIVFKDGRVMVEICDVFGEKRVAVPQEMAAFYLALDTTFKQRDQLPDNDQKQKAQGDCAFCFAQANMDYNSGDAVAVPLIFAGYQHQTDFFTKTLSIKTQSYSARAPPFTLS